MANDITRLYEEVEQLRDILTGRETYNDDTECLDNAIATFENIDEIVERLALDSRLA